MRCRCRYSLVDCSCGDGKPLPLFLLRLLHAVMEGMDMESIGGGVLRVAGAPSPHPLLIVVCFTQLFHFLVMQHS